RGFGGVKAGSRRGGAETRRTQLPVLVLGAGALGFAIRLLYLRQIWHAPFFNLRFGDAESYHLWARRIADGDWLGSGVFYQAPLYPYFLACIYRVLGDSPGTVRIVQALMGGVACGLLAWTGARLWGRRGVLAGVLLAIYAPGIFLDGVLEKSALVTLLFAALLAVVAAADVDWRAWLAVGATLGLVALARENGLLLLLPLAAWCAWGARARWIGAAALVAGCALMLLPVATRNLAIGGEFVLTTSQFGPNFYIGNHAGADGTYQALVEGHGSAADERDDATRIAEQSAGRKLSAGDVSSYWTRRAMDFVPSHPGSWLALLGRKLALTFNATEAPDSESIEVFADESWLLHGLSWWNFGMLCAFAIGGAITSRRFYWVYGIAATYAASVVLFYVFARYRFPLVIALMLLAP